MLVVVKKKKGFATLSREKVTPADAQGNLLSMHVYFMFFLIYLVGLSTFVLINSDYILIVIFFKILSVCFDSL